jgi:hypothetical protein
VRETAVGGFRIGRGEKAVVGSHEDGNYGERPELNYGPVDDESRPRCTR